MLFFMQSILVFGTLIGTTGAERRPRQAASDSLGKFPVVEGRSLEGRRFRLPGDFEGRYNVVLVAFKREQQSDVDTWTPFLKPLAAARSDVRVYEVPTLGRRYRLMRAVIDGGMRGGIPDRSVRAATITLYIDKLPYRRSLKLVDEDRIYVLLVDRQGKVLWRAEGRFSEASGRGLAQRIERGEVPAGSTGDPRR